MTIKYGSQTVSNGIAVALDAGNSKSYDQSLVTSTNNAQTAYTSSGTYSFVVPVGITSISAVAVGGGGGGGGSGANYDGGAGGGAGLAYGTFAVTPGETLTIIVAGGGNGGSSQQAGSSATSSQVKRGSTFLIVGGGGFGGTAGSANHGSGGNGGTITGISTAGGGNGGAGGAGFGNGGGGGGAGGYSGSGGNGSGGGQGAGSDGSGGGGGGAGNHNGSTPYDGGGVGILGEGSSGTGGAYENNGNPGSGGSGKTYGGGGGAAYRQFNNNNLSGNAGGGGAVRLVYQPTIGNRQYPNGSGTLSNLADATYTIDLPSDKWKDLSVNDNNGDISGATFYTAEGGYFDFDGSDDVIEIDNHSSLDISPNITISVWINPSGFGESNYGRIIDSKDSYNFFMDNTGGGGTGTNAIRYWPNTGSALSVNNAVTLNQWANFTVTQTGANVVIYKNGFSIGTSSSYTTLPSIGANKVRIGNSLAGDRAFDGKISQVLVYNRTLTASEILQNFNAQRRRYGI